MVVHTAAAVRTGEELDIHLVVAVVGGTRDSPVAAAEDGDIQVVVAEDIQGKRAVAFCCCCHQGQIRPRTGSKT